jgi:DNA replication protein DnaC
MLLERLPEVQSLSVEDKWRLIDELWSDLAREVARAGVDENTLALLNQLSSTFIDELGYLPLDKRGAELLFQVITKRYERGSIIITTNIAFKDWPRIFAGDATMTSALLDRLLHHAQPVIIEGDSYRSAKRK